MHVLVMMKMTLMINPLGQLWMFVGAFFRGVRDDYVAFRLIRNVMVSTLTILCISNDGDAISEMYIS